jgi:hypothetical protein
MPPVHAVIVSPEEAYDGNAELWCGSELMAVTVLQEDGLHLRIDPRRDGEPWLVETTSLARALKDAAQDIAAY